MPLITCADCQTEMSDAAPACPRCGRPANSRSTGTKAAVPFVLAGLVLAMAGAFLYSPTADLGWYGTMGGILAMLAGGVLVVFGFARLLMN